MHMYVYSELPLYIDTAEERRGLLAFAASFYVLTAHCVGQWFPCLTAKILYI